MDSKSLNTSSDSQLLNIIRTDNRMAFTILYDRYWERLYRAAYNVLSDEAIAKDVVQEIFLNIWRNRHTQQIENFSAYSLQAVKFQIAQHLRRGKLTDKHLKQISDVAAVDTTSEVMDYNELRVLVDRTLNHLPERCRDVFYMSRFENLTNKEIAERLNLSTRTVEWHISNALKHLRHAIDDVVALSLCLAFMARSLMAI